jgi:hypothetical protein
MPDSSATTHWLWQSCGDASAAPKRADRLCSLFLVEGVRKRAVKGAAWQMWHRKSTSHSFNSFEGAIAPFRPDFYPFRSARVGDRHNKQVIRVTHFSITEP